MAVPVLPRRGGGVAVAAVVQQGHRRRVVHRPQHPGHVAKGRRGAPALVQGTGRLPLEVEDVPAGVGAHHLAQVVIAVDPGGDAGVDPPQPVEHVGQPTGSEERPDLALDVVGPRPAVARRAPERLRQRRVHAGGGLAQPAGLGREVAAGLCRVGRGGRRGRDVGVDHRDGLGVEDAEEVPQRRQGQGPALHRTVEEGLEQGEVEPGCRLGAEGRRDPREPHPAEPGGDLDLGVRPRLQPPEQLEDEALVVDEGAVRLLRADRSGPGRRLGPAGDPVEHHEGQLRVEDGVVGGGRALAPVDDAQHRPVVAPQELRPLPLRPQADDELVSDAVGVHHQTHQLRPVVADDVLVDDGHRLRRLLAGVPALLRKVVPQDLEGDHWPWSGSTSSNQ